MPTDFTEQQRRYIWGEIDENEEWNSILERDYLPGEDVLESNSKAINQILDSLNYISFGEYIKRYLYQSVFISEGLEFKEINNKAYLDYCCRAFKDNGILDQKLIFPLTRAEDSWTIDRDWIKRKLNSKTPIETCARDIVFIWGFGLNMNQEDVSMFLKKVIREIDFRFRSPLETIFWYSFKEKLKYGGMLELLDSYNQGIEPNQEYLRDLADNQANDTFYYMDELPQTKSELKNRLAGLKAIEQEELSNELDNYKQNLLKVNSTEEKAQLRREYLIVLTKYYLHSRAAKDVFDELFNEYTNAYIDEKNRENYSQIEREFYITPANQPDRYGNLFAGRRILYRWLNKSKLDRDALRNIRNGNRVVRREDILTLCLFLFDCEEYLSPQDRFSAFETEANSYLSSCNMEDFYITNPYESFLAICVMSKEPIDTFHSFWDEALATNKTNETNET